jgi:hypothetical protein
MQNLKAMAMGVVVAIAFFLAKHGQPSHIEEPADYFVSNFKSDSKCDFSNAVFRPLPQIR